MRSPVPLLPILALLLLAGCGPAASASRTSDTDVATGTSAPASAAAAANPGTPGCGTPGGRFTRGGGSVTAGSNSVTVCLKRSAYGAGLFTVRFESGTAASPKYVLIVIAGAPRTGTFTSGSGGDTPGLNMILGSALSKNPTPVCRLTLDRAEQSGVSGSFACDGGVHGEFSADA